MSTNFFKLSGTDNQQQSSLPAGFKPLTNDQMSRIKGGFDDEGDDDDSWDDTNDPPEEELPGDPPIE